MAEHARKGIVISMFLDESNVMQSTAYKASALVERTVVDNK